ILEGEPGMKRQRPERRSKKKAARRIAGHAVIPTGRPSPFLSHVRQLEGRIRKRENKGQAFISEWRIVREAGEQISAYDIRGSE
ncbi:MAG: hypothetical protein ACREQK_04600, partial [Candidatus Binatia bacterium]